MLLPLFRTYFPRFPSPQTPAPAPLTPVFSSCCPPLRLHLLPQQTHIAHHSVTHLFPYRIPNHPVPLPPALGPPKRFLQSHPHVALELQERTLVRARLDMIYDCIRWNQSITPSRNFHRSCCWPQPRTCLPEGLEIGISAPPSHQALVVKHSSVSFRG